MHIAFLVGATLTLVPAAVNAASTATTTPSHTDVQRLLERAEHCEAGIQFGDEAALLATCDGKPGETETHTMIVGLLTEAIAHCPVPDQIPEASTTVDVLDLLEIAAKQANDAYLAALTTTLRKHQGKPAETRVLTATRQSFNAWLTANPTVRLHVQSTRTRVVVDRAQATAILDRTRAQIAEDSKLRAWYPTYLAGTRTELDAVIAKATSATRLTTFSREDGTDHFSILAPRTVRFPDRDFHERRDAYLANARRFQERLDDYLVATIAAYYGTETPGVAERLLRARVPQFVMAYKLERGGDANRLGETEREAAIDTAAGTITVTGRPIVRIDIDDTLAYGDFAETIAHEIDHAMLQADRAAIERIERPAWPTFGDSHHETIVTRTALRELLLEGITEFATQRARTILAAHHNEERHQRTSDDAGLLGYPPIVEVVTLLASAGGERDLLSWHTGHLKTTDLRTVLHGALRTYGIKDHDENDHMIDQLLTTDLRNWDFFDATGMRFVAEIERKGLRPSDHIAAQVPFLSDHIRQRIANHESLADGEQLTADRALALYRRVQAAHAMPDLTTLLALSTYFGAHASESYSMYSMDGLAGREAQATSLARICLQKATQLHAKDPRVIMAWEEHRLRERSERREDEDAFDVNLRNYREVAAVAATDPGNIRWQFIALRSGIRAWTRKRPELGMEVLAHATQLLIRIRGNRAHLVEATKDGVWERPGTDHGLPPIEERCFIFCWNIHDPMDALTEHVLNPLVEAGIITDPHRTAQAWRSTEATVLGDAALTFLAEQARALTADLTGPNRVAPAAPH
ncbi:hypothetical protein HYV74_00670 [Candidatus Uhrbacteria bacterium]|nr:hypothetical protein [Candidatus Uhrbacteria bacterium]